MSNDVEFGISTQSSASDGASSAAGRHNGEAPCSALDLQSGRWIATCGELWAAVGWFLRFVGERPDVRQRHVDGNRHRIGVATSLRSHVAALHSRNQAGGKLFRIRVAAQPPIVL